MTTTPLVDTLVENAKYMPQANDNNGQPSKCETECQSQQTSLVTCMNLIRDAKEKVNDTSSNNNDVNPCLGPSIAAWTDCCTKASEN
jgi:hypothetical protein